MSDTEAQALLIDAASVYGRGGRIAALVAARAALDVAETPGMRQRCEDAVRWHARQQVRADAVPAVAPTPT